MLGQQHAQTLALPVTIISHPDTRLVSIRPLAPYIVHALARIAADPRPRFIVVSRAGVLDAG
jgi:hypothetical protein